MHPGLCIKNTEAIFSLPLSNENITAIKSYQYNSSDSPPHYWISNEQLEIKNNSFTTLVERNLKKNVVKDLCKNFNVEEFNIRLLGVRFCDSSCFIAENGQASTEPLVLQPSSLGVASQRSDFKDFCATVCIQVDAIILYLFCLHLCFYIYSFHRSIRAAP